MWLNEFPVNVCAEQNECKLELAQLSSALPIHWYKNWEYCIFLIFSLATMTPIRWSKYVYRDIVSCMAVMPCPLFWIHYQNSTFDKKKLKKSLVWEKNIYEFLRKLTYIKSKLC